MNIDQITNAVVSSYPSRQPLMIWGPPGVGKSTGVNAAADILREQFKASAGKKKPAEDFGFIDLRLPLIEAVDLHGLPFVKDGMARWALPGMLPTGGRGILCLDEIVQAEPSKQAAASQLVLDRRCGEYRLPDGWHIIAAGNRLSDRSASHAMPLHIANRFLHLDADVSVDGWVRWALAHKIDIRLIAFIKWRPALLHAFDPQSKALAFPTPRSWEFVSNLLTKSTMPADILPDMVKGAVGAGPAAEFVGFMRVFDKMPSIDAILTNPGKATIPGDPATRYAVVTALSCRATKDNLHHLVTYFNRMSDEAQAPEYSVAAIKTILAGDPTLGNTRAFIEWAAKHNHLMV